MSVSLFLLRYSSSFEAMKKSLANQIICLLKRSHTPRVTVSESTITGRNRARAGRGVFSKQSVSPDELPMVMCLYPGIYTPGIPIHAMGCSAEYLANQSPPSNYGSDIGENAYIMNLATCGGYIDGCALESQYDQNDVLDSNPSACGHLVNHDAVTSNVEEFSFVWGELADHDAQSVHLKREEYFSIPNELRADGSPWYYDIKSDQLVLFPNRDETPLLRKMVCGIALLLTNPISQNEELLLNYGLKEPHPLWAQGWYNGST